MACALSSVFFFNDAATTEIYTLSLHDALPIWSWKSWATRCAVMRPSAPRCSASAPPATPTTDRKSTRLNSSHQIISYAVFCLKKKKKKKRNRKNISGLRYRTAKDTEEEVGNSQ